MGTHPDGDAVIAAMRQVAAEEIVPRFCRLADHEVSEKSGPSDLVTIADTESERHLTAALTDMVPGSVVVGEEGCEADPARLRALSGDAPVWLIDPVDGTRNFVKGEPCFAVIVGYCLAGEVRAGWILDPLADRVVFATKGGGAWVVTADSIPVRLRIGAAKPVAAMAGSLGWKTAQRLRELDHGRGTSVPARIVRLGCTGREYMDLVNGDLDFVQYTRLKPWDHAAGLLIHAEAGGFARMVENGRPYRPEPRVMPGTVLAAADEHGWQALRSCLEATRRDRTLPL